MTLHVAIEPATLPDESRREILPGVAEVMTRRLWVGFQLDRPPVFSAAVGPWTAPLRELGYGIVGLLVGAKQLPLIRGRVRAAEDRPGQLRQQYRALRSSLAANLVLPGYQPAVQLDQQWEGVAPGFEASRRVIDFEDNQGPFRLICHVFAPLQTEVTERLLEGFVEEFNKKQAESAVCDISSDLCLFGHSSIRLPRRQYWEIVIGQPERLADVSGYQDSVLLSGETAGIEVGQIASDGRTVKSVRDSEQPGQGAIGSALVDTATVDEINARSALDWDFMASEIARAVEAHVALDDDFIEDLARRRFEHAQTALAAEKPGPTLESSRRVAREVVAIHRLALNPEDDAAQ